ncbi:YfbU family protein [Acetobacter okinawensis]|uniref:YfbU family protein n=1 Tax=Acetobacter okinawensis TaxID=1076594 RepID=UPI00209E5EC9|nr:YfbU family protein [Acetobacter okinawensis]MCP1213781.1 YfbU family protein [Acetobacter okinawensis]
MSPKSERIELRLDEGFLSRIDDWRNSQTRQPSRSEAIRALVDIGLQAKDTTRLKFSDGEKFIIAMLAERFQDQKPSIRFSQNPIISSLMNGNYWALEAMFKGIFNDKYCEPQVAFEVTQILEMCENIESNINRLGEKERNILQYKFLDGRENVFVGFSLHQEEMYKNAVSQILLSPMRFETFKRRRLNDSPAGRLEIYRRMHRALISMGKDASQDRHYLSFPDLELVLDAGFGTH